MTQNIQGPLYDETMSRKGPVMAFIHPNPMDLSCWLFQMEHRSTWYRCVAVDPGCGGLPKADEGPTTTDIAEVCCAATGDSFAPAKSIVVGSTVGSLVAPVIYHQHPAQWARLRINAYRTHGIDYRWWYTFEDSSPAFCANPLAELITERNQLADLQTNIRQFDALEPPEPAAHYEGITCPTLILTGREDSSHKLAFGLEERLPGCELRILPSAGYACERERPWLVDRFMRGFLERHGLFPDEALSVPPSTTTGVKQ